VLILETSTSPRRQQKTHPNFKLKDTSIIKGAISRFHSWISASSVEPGVFLLMSLIIQRYEAKNFISLMEALPSFVARELVPNESY
jgi:hypothetical protein